MNLGLRSKLVIAFTIVMVLPVLIIISFFIFQETMTRNNDSLNDIEHMDKVFTDINNQVEKKSNYLKDYDEFYQQIKSTLERYNAEIQVMDSHFQLIFDSTDKKASLNSYKMTLQDFNGYNVKKTNVYKYFGSISPDNNYLISIKVNKDKIIKEFAKSITYSILGILLFTILLVVGLVGYFTWSISRDILKPLSQLNKATNSIMEGNLDVGIDYQKDNELGQFCQTFDEMRIRLKESLEKQAEYENARKELIASISHDLRTPITSIKGYVEGLIDGVAQSQDRVDHYLKVILDKTTKLDYLIEDLFQFSRLELGRLEMNYGIENGREMLEEILEPIILDFEEDSIELTVESPLPEQPIKVDKNRINQVLDNLMENARRYIGEEGQVRIDAKVVDDFLQICVEDTGPGIAESDRPYIFDKFYRGEKSRSREYGGTGLGLAICKEIIEEHNGEIWLDSGYGEGSRFCFTIPIYKLRNS